MNTHRAFVLSAFLGLCAGGCLFAFTFAMAALGPQ